MEANLPRYWEMLNNAFWNLSCVHSFFHRACALGMAMLRVQSAIWQRFFRYHWMLPKQESGQSALTLHISNLLQRQWLEACDSFGEIYVNHRQGFL